MLPIIGTVFAEALTSVHTLSSIAMLPLVLIGAIRRKLVGKEARRGPAPPPVPFAWL